MYIWKSLTIKRPNFIKNILHIFRFWSSELTVLDLGTFVSEQGAWVLELGAFQFRARNLWIRSLDLANFILPNLPLMKIEHNGYNICKRFWRFLCEAKNFRNLIKINFYGFLWKVLMNFWNLDRQLKLWERFLFWTNPFKICENWILLVGTLATIH